MRAVQRSPRIRFSSVACVLALLPVAAPLWSQGVVPGAKPAAKFTRPAYQVLRQNEDWSVLKNRPAEAPTDPFDGAKYVAFGESGAVWASFGGQVRVRAESWDNFNFGTRAPGVAVDDEFGLLRVLLHGDFHFGKSFRFFAQAKSSVLTDRSLTGGKRAIDRDDFDLQNAFAELSLPVGGTGKFWVRAGRQELLFGKQRLISPLDWVNTRRTFEGAAALVKSGPWTMTGFFVQPVLVDATDFNKADDSTDFYGVYGTYKRAGSQLGLDFYLLGLDRERATFAGIAGAEERRTLGARFEVTAPRYDIEVEAAYQDGDLGASDIEAVMGTLVVGFAEREHWRAPRVYGAIDYASGDDRPRDGKIGTFNHLFPLSHAFFGYTDFIGRQNILDLQVGFQTKLTKKTSAQIDWHSFHLASANDGLYGVTGAQGRRANPGGSKAVGYEIDLVLRRPFNVHASLELGLSRFQAGQYLEQTGASDNVNWAYLIAQYTF